MNLKNQADRKSNSPNNSHEISASLPQNQTFTVEIAELPNPRCVRCTEPKCPGVPANDPYCLKAIN